MRIKLRPAGYPSYSINLVDITEIHAMCLLKANPWQVRPVSNAGHDDPVESPFDEPYIPIRRASADVRTTFLASLQKVCSAFGSLVLPVDPVSPVTPSSCGCGITSGAL